MSAILQISDTHIVAEGTLVSQRLDTSAALERLVTRIGTLRGQIGTIEAVLVSGDVSDDGRAESYARFTSLLAPLDLPVYVIPGNHDARGAMRDAFGAHLPAQGPLNWMRRVGEIVVIGLDTLVEGQGGGEISAHSLEFLKTALAEAGSRPVLLAMHHPPFPTGIAFMDRIGLSNAQALGQVVSAHRHPLRILCGHIHCMMVSDFGGHVALSAPSPCSSFAFDTRAQAPVGFMLEQDGCLLHRYDAGFQSVRIGPVDGGGPFPF